MNVQHITAAHWRAILAIQAEAYAEFGPEELAVLKSKVAASPKSCLVGLSEQGAVQAYLLAHPWSGEAPPSLFKPLAQATVGEYLYLHDMAVQAQFKGQGVGRAMFQALSAVTQEMGINAIRLVAVQGSAGFWASLGFSAIAAPELCASYGEDAVLMEKYLPS